MTSNSRVAGANSPSAPKRDILQVNAGGIIGGLGETVPCLIEAVGCYEGLKKCVEGIVLGG